jgi:hypothetical protein
MTFNLTDALLIVLIASINSVVLCFGLYLTLSKTKTVDAVQN